MDDSTKKTIGKVVASVRIFFFGFMVPSMVILFLFLGSLQERYSYESNLSASLNYSLGQAGSAVYRIYDIGRENPKWFYYSLIILIGLLIQVIYGIFSLFKVKDSQRLSDDAGGAAGVDEDSNIVKGGRKVI